MSEAQARPRGFLASRSGIVMIGFIVIGGFLLFTEHRAHVLGVLPFALLLLCPVLHMFHHGGHGGHGGHDQHAAETQPPGQEAREEGRGRGDHGGHHHTGAES